MLMPENSYNKSEFPDATPANADGQAQYRDFIALRVRNFAQRLGYNASSLGKALDIPRSTVPSYWKGEKAWPLELIPFVAATLQVTPEDLVSLEGTSSGSLPVERISSRSDTVAVREIDLSYGMGATYLDVPVTEEVHQFPRAWLRRYTRAAPDQLFFAQGLGDSMEPTLFDSDLLLIDTSQRTLNMAEKIWAIAYADCGMIKRLRPVPNGGVEVWSDKKEVSPFTAYDGELDIIGRVVAVQRKL
jgi:phage repressor protein C with HTH and peptisase S24 domain